MNSDCTLATAIAIVVSAALSGILAHYLTKRRHRQGRIEKAKDFFLDAFEDDLLIFSGKYDGMPLKINRIEFMAKIFAKQDRAMARYERFLFCLTRWRLNRAINNYHGYLRRNKFETWFNLEGVFSVSDNVVRHMETAHKMVKRIRRFAK